LATVAELKTTLLQFKKFCLWKQRKLLV